MRGVPYRIETDRLVLRCWDPADAPLLKAAIDGSLDRLRRFMPWAAYEPTAVGELAERLRRFRGRYDLDEDHIMAIFDRAEGEVLGGTGLHPRGGDTLEIGYWIATGHEGKGYVTEAVAALTRVAIELVGAARVTILCDPRNVRSAAVPRRLGFIEEGLLRARIEAVAGGLTDALSFSMFPEEYRDSPCFAADLRAFDAAGRPMA